MNPHSSKLLARESTPCSSIESFVKTPAGKPLGEGKNVIRSSLSRDPDKAHTHQGVLDIGPGPSV